MSYLEIKNKELKSVHAGFSISNEMSNAIKNEMWRNKVGLWSILSASCDETAARCFEHIQKFADSLINIDTCDVHTLKSIAKSVDLGFLCENIKEDLPFDIMELINIFSINKSVIFNSNSVLDESSTNKIGGSIVDRMSKIVSSDDYDMNLLFNIKLNINHISAILNTNMIFTSMSIKDTLSKEYLEILKEHYGVNDGYKRFDMIILNKLENVINKIDLVNDVDLNKFKKRQLITPEGRINWFYILEVIIKDHLYNEENDFYLVPMYMNDEMNAEIDLSNIFISLASFEINNDETYKKHFISYHFYNTIVSKLKNASLFSMFNIMFNSKLNCDVFIANRKLSEYSETELTDMLKEYLDSDEIEELMQQQYPMTNNARLSNEKLSIKLSCFSKSVLDFAIYMKFIKMFKKSFARNSGVSNAEAETYYDDTLKFDILKINFYHSNIYKENRSDDDLHAILFKKGGLIEYIADTLTNMCVAIQKIRDDIKTKIQQYNFIGTRRIATDILTEFFLNNYNRDDYILPNDIEINETKLIDTLKPLKTLLNEDSKFTIDIIEYYDLTEYLNIESDMPSIKVGEVIDGVTEKTTWWIGEDNLMTSGIVSSNIYKDIYAPCSQFVTEYNSKFWENAATTFNEDDTGTNFLDSRYDFKSYSDFYSQYFTTFGKMNSTEKKAFVKDELYPLLVKVWDAFALSAISENDTDADAVKQIYKEYLGNDAGVDKYRNNANKVFPTIASMVNIDGLVETSEFAEDILYVAKNYYRRVAKEMIAATVDMLKMYDSSFVPFEDWRQKHITFHGYSTYYEYSDNKSMNDILPNKKIDFDGPWVYSVLQRYLYETNLNGENANYHFILDGVDIPLAQTIEEELIEYLNSGNSIYKRSNILTHHIAKAEYDVDRNYFTLMKADDSNVGIVLFRLNDVPLSMPLSKHPMTNAEGQTDRVVGIVRNLADECIDFGILDRGTMWMFGMEQVKGNSIKLYRLCTFKFEVIDSCIKIDSSTFKSYSNVSYSDYLYNLNDFIGVSAHDETALVITYNCNDSLAKLKSATNERLFSNDVNINVHSLDLMSNTVKSKQLTVSNALTPMFLDHSKGSSSLTMYDNSIWKVEKYSGKCYICYEALNKNEDNDFSYYTKYDTSTIKIEMLEIVFNENATKIYENTSNDNMQFSSLIQFMTNNEEVNDHVIDIVIDNKANQRYILTNVLYSLLSEYPKCLYKNGKFTVQVIPFAFYKECSNSIRQYIASELTYTIPFTERMRNPVRERYMHPIRFDEFSNVKSLFSFSNINAKAEDIDKFGECIDEHKTILDYIDTIKTNNIKEITDPSFANTADLFKLMPFVKKCMINNMIIVCYFKNETGITFLNDYAFDLDLTCYIDDVVERDKKVGYGNGYTGTNYIKWMGDVTQGGYEGLFIDVKKYIKNKYENTDVESYMKIALNLCWHETSEIMSDNVYVSINWNMIKEDIPIKLLKIAKKDCQNRVLSIKVNMKDETLQYEMPKLYPAIKIAYKEKIVGYEDGVPDIQVGLINLTDDEFENLGSMGWAKYTYDSDGRNITRMFSHAVKDATFKTSSKKLDFATYIINTPMPEKYFNNQKGFIIEILSNYFGMKANRLNYVTKQRLSYANYTTLCLDDIYFGDNVSNIDPDTGINMIYYAYLNPTYFREYAGMYSYEIDAAILSFNMTHMRGFVELSMAEDALAMKKILFKYIPMTAERLADYDEYVSTSDNMICTVNNFFEYVLTKYADNAEKLAEYEDFYESYKVSDEDVEILKANIRSVIGIDPTPDDIEEAIHSYETTEYRHKMTVKGFFNYIQQCAYDLYCKYDLQDVYLSLG